MRPVVIENKAGAGGGIGMGYVAKAKPDGYTLLLALSSISILPEADKVTGRAPMYQLNQFVPIARFTADPTVLAVRADSPWKTLAGIRRRRTQASRRDHLWLVRQLRNDAHADGDVRCISAESSCCTCRITGAGPAVVGAARRQRRRAVDGAVDGDPAREGRQAARARIVGRPAARVAARRPTLTEAGYAVVFTSGRRCSRRRARRSAIAKLRDAARGAAADPQFVATMATVETPIQYLDAPELQRFWDADNQKLGEASSHREGRVSEPRPEGRVAEYASVPTQRRNAAQRN